MIKLEVVVILFFRAHKVTIIFHIIGINMPYFMLFNIKYLDIAIFWKPSIVFFVKTLACLKYLRTFAPLLTKSTSEKKFWRGGSGSALGCGAVSSAGSGTAAGCKRTGHQDGHRRAHNALVFHLDFPPSLWGFVLCPLRCLYDTRFLLV